MSEFLAEARVRITPDTTRFRAELQESINRAIAQAQITPVRVPVVIGTAGAGLEAAGGAAAGLAASQQIAIRSTTELDTANRIANTSWARQAVLIEEAAIATQVKGAADRKATTDAVRHAAAESAVGKAAIASTAGMLGLRGAVLTASGAFIAATVGFQALGKAIGSAVSFERELNVFQITAGATADQMERVQQVARDLGRDITLPGVAANDAAQTLSLLARAGLSVEDSLDAVRGTLQLATAAEIENAAAAELVANALNAFKLDGAEATRVADLLAGAANESQGSITDMGLALKQVSAIASGLGVSIDATITILTQLSRAGLSASDAGTSFRQTLLRLIQDLPRVEKEVKSLGLNLRDISGNIRPEVFEELGQKLRRLTPAARQLAIANLGGADAIRTLLVLTRAQAGEFDAVADSITRAGIAQDLAAARTKGLGGDVEGAKNQFADLGLTIGNIASGPLSLFVRTAGAAAGAANELNRELSESEGGQGFGEAFGNFINRFSETFARMNINFREGVRLAALGKTEYSSLIPVFDTLTDSVQNFGSALTGALNELSRQAAQGAPKDEGIGIKGILGRVTGFDSAETRARIRGSTTELLSVLQAEQDFLRGQLERQFVQNRPALRDRLQDALLGSLRDVDTITKQGAADAKRSAEAAKRIADDALRARQEADRAFLELLGTRREDAASAAAVAASEGSAHQAIQAQNRLQAIIKAQIQTIRNRVKDEQLRKAAIRELRIALNASRREEEALRQEQIEEQQARIDEIQQLNISIAEERGNDAALDRAINARITRINKQIKAAKGDQIRVKELVLERERLKNQLEELRKKEKEIGKTAQQAFFEMLQTQKGFASNLLGNLIPLNATAGLVGNVSPPPAAQVQAQAAVKAGRDQGVSPGQFGELIGIQERMLAVLVRMLQGSGHPEVNFRLQEKKAAFDTPFGV